MWDRGTTNFHKTAVQNFVAKHEIGILFVALSEKAVLLLMQRTSSFTQQNH